MICCDKWEEFDKQIDITGINFCPYCGASHKIVPEYVETHVYLHSNKETMIELGEEIGLVGDALDTFCYALYEVNIFLRVNTTTGTYEILYMEE